MSDFMVDIKDRIRVNHRLNQDTDFDKIIEILDNALKQGGDLGVYGDLSPGLQSLVQDFYITVTEDEEVFYVDCAPMSGQGHDFGFSIIKKTGLIDENSICVGEVEEEPDLDEECG